MCVPSTLSDEAAQVGPGEDKVAAVAATPTDAARVGPGEDKVVAVAAIPTAASSQRRLRLGTSGDDSRPSFQAM